MTRLIILSFLPYSLPIPLSVLFFSSSYVKYKDLNGTFYMTNVKSSAHSMIYNTGKLGSFHFNKIENLNQTF